MNEVRNAVRDDQSGKSTRQIFDEVVGASPYANLLDFNSIKLSLRVS